MARFAQLCGTATPSESERTRRELRKRLYRARCQSAKYAEYVGKAEHARKIALASHDRKTWRRYTDKQHHYEAKRDGYKSALAATYRDIDQCQ